ncbi:MAG: hypothetical protein EOP04_24155 [Proteobacteria bacterium]|nr:MAG: hypothetical protein EOP04_24155 [Pseudomonadota bacterium]
MAISNKEYMIFGIPGRSTNWGIMQIQTYCSHTECYITKKSVLKLFGYSSSINWLAEYVQTFERFTAIPGKLLEDLKNPVTLEIMHERKTLAVEVYRTSTLFRLCEFIASAKDDGFIGLLDMKIAATAQKIIQLQRELPIELASAEFTGLNFFRSAQKERITELLQNQSGLGRYFWVGILPGAFIQRLLQLRGLSWSDLPDKLSELSSLLQSHLFLRLPSGLAETLDANRPKRGYRRTNYQPQNIGNHDLQEMITVVTGLIITAQQNEAVLTQLLDRIYPLSTHLEVDITPVGPSLGPNEEAIKKLLF